MGRRFSNGLPCPLAADDRAWIDRRWQWLAEQFGPDFPVNRPVVLPTAAFFSNTSTETQEGIEALFSRVCQYMAIDRGSVVMVLFEPPSNTLGTTSTALGSYRELAGGKFEISVATQNFDDPYSFVGTVAHELAHVHLLGHRRLTVDDADHELLTDLLPVYFGMGVFGANSVIYEKSWHEGQMSYWQAGKRGYMSMAMHSYAMAKLAHHRHDPTAAWAKSLRPDVRAEFKLFLDVIGGKSPLIEDPIDESAASPAAEAVPDGEVIEGETADEPEHSPEEFLARYSNGTRDFQRMNFIHFRLVGAELTGCNFTDCDFSAADLSRAELTDCDFTGAILNQTTLEHAKLNRSNLRESILHCANLNRADLRECNLCDTDFRCCQLEGTDVTGSRRNNGTNFLGADVSRVVCDCDLSEEIVRTQQQNERESRASGGGDFYYTLTIFYACTVVVLATGVQTSLRVPSGVASFVTFALFVLVFAYRIRNRMRGTRNQT